MDNFIKHNYPDAQEGKAFTRKCIHRLVSEFSFNLDKTLMATSVCSDEIIRSATNFREYLNVREPFQLGGLAGYPFTGLTGVQAFAAHVPDEGAALILYGSHIGVSRSGEIGTMQRVGQIRESACCGALQASLTTLQERNEPAADPELDYQLWKIEKEFVLRRESILAHTVPLVAATDSMFGIIDRTLHNLINASRIAGNVQKIALVGGVIINTDFNLPDWFDLRRFEVIEQ